MQKIKQDLSLGENIRALRMAANLTQQGVTTQMQLMGCDISRSMYSQIEGGTYNIRVSELIALKKLLGVDYNAFFAPLEENE